VIGREKGHGRASAPPDAPVIELRAASIGYGEQRVLRNATLSVRRGDVVALVGPNGAGKTTLVRGVLGLAKVLAGDVDLFGVPANRFRERWRIGYVPQRHTVGGGVPSTVEEVVGSGRLARRPLLSRTSTHDRQVVADAIATVGLTERRRAAVATLSGGQQRRTLIARALASEPEVLVMDEPTAGVDAASQVTLVRTLGRLVAQGLTLVVVTHEVGPLLDVLTRVVVVEDGRITRDDLLAATLGAEADARWT
jgi:zinc transport system ATP-binding protein